MNPVRIFFAALLIGAVAVFTLLAGYHRTEVVQRGYRGTGLNLLYRESTLEALDKINVYPKPLGPAKTEGPRASETFENVQVVGDLSKSQFARLMLSIKAWVAPQVGCNLCHAAPVYNSDEKYTKRVARQMLKMVRHINTDWTQHVGKTGVTCYTCHRGNQVPQKLWWSSTPINRSGLTLEKSWAEYLTISMTVAFLPWELWELAHGVSLFRVGVLITNLLVLGYLLWLLDRKKKAAAR